MHPIRLLSTADQAAAHLRAALRRGRWRGTMPGVARLAKDLNVAPTTLQKALRQLEREGLLQARGRGRSRTITRSGEAQRRLRVGILAAGTLLDRQPETDEVLFRIEHDLEAAGHEVFFSRKSQTELHDEVPRLKRHLRENPADAWIVDSGSRPLLEWLAGEKTPCLALYGRTDGLKIARTGPEKRPAYIAATRQLIALGHKRIVLITRGDRRKPAPGNIEQAFLEELAVHGIKSGPYNLPDWQETPEGYETLLVNLFRVTPPTALIIEESPRVVAALHFLARRHISLPEQVSLVATDYDTSLAWCHPVIAHMRWDHDPIVRRIVRWVAAVRKGCADREALNFPALFVPGGSIGPAPAGGRNRGGQ